MGLISMVKNIAGAAGDAVSSQVKDQYLEFFTQDALGQDVLAVRGAKRMSKGKNKGSVDVISNGSMIAVPEGTAVVLVDNGQVVDFATAGMYTWDSSSAPSCLANLDFLDNMKAVVKDTWNRMRMGGELATQQRVYFINIQEIRDQNFGTATPLPYPDPEYRNIYIRLNGKFSFKVADPVIFFKNVVSNVTKEFTTQDLMGTVSNPKMPRTEFLDHMTEVLNMCATRDKISFGALPSAKTSLRKYMQECLDEDWFKARGIVVESVALGIPTPDDKSRERIEQIDSAKMFSNDPNALAAQAVLGQTEAMKTAAGNSAGAVNGFMGMGMVGGMGGANMANNAFQFMGQGGGQPAAQQSYSPMGAGAVVGAAAATAAGWTCECGTTNQGKFCGNCGKPQPAPQPAGWTCECGNVNQGKFCGTCGKPQPAVAPADWTCECGQAGNTGKFCANCGKPKA